MAKTQTSNTERQNAGKRKKQAKQEAKAMLKVEQAKKDVQKAEQKAAKAQTKLEARRTSLHDLEQKLNSTRAPQQSETPQEAQLPLLTPESVQNNGATQGDQELPFVSTPELDTGAIAAFHSASIAPSEGRDDVASDQVTDQTMGEDQAAQQVINAQASSTFEPAEGREDISSDASSSNDEDQPLTEAESDTTTDPTSGDTYSNAPSSNDGDQPLTEAESDTTTDPTSESSDASSHSTASATSEGS